MNKFYIVLLFVISASSQATVIDNDWYTTDTNQGLDFLDVEAWPASGTFSADDIPMNTYDYFNNGIDFRGSRWVLASVEQLDSLFNDFLGYEDWHDDGDTRDFKNDKDSEKIIDLMSGNPDCPTLACSIHAAWVLEETTRYGDTYNSLQIHGCIASTNGRCDTYHNDTHRAEITSTDKIHAFLVRQSIPEPTTLAIFGLGLMSLFGVNRRKSDAC